MFAQRSNIAMEQLWRLVEGHCWGDTSPYGHKVAHGPAAITIHDEPWLLAMSAAGKNIHV